MTNPQLFRLRIRFCKQGRLAMLSHLEVAHSLERAVRRSGLPFAVSQGFSPHMKLAFGAALPVRVGGTSEIVDLQLTHYIDTDKALKALQEQSVEDLMVTDCYYIESSDPAASVAFPFSTYEAQLLESANNFVVPETVSVIRKKKERTLIVKDYLVQQPTLVGNRLTFVLEQKPTGSLRPDVFLKACGLKYSSITRVRQENNL